MSEMVESGRPRILIIGPYRVRNGRGRRSLLPNGPAPSMLERRKPGHSPRPGCGPDDAFDLDQGMAVVFRSRIAASASFQRVALASNEEHAGQITSASLSPR